MRGRVCPVTPITSRHLRARSQAILAREISRICAKSMAVPAKAAYRHVPTRIYKSACAGVRYWPKAHNLVREYKCTPRVNQSSWQRHLPCLEASIGLKGIPVMVLRAASVADKVDFD